MRLYLTIVFIFSLTTAALAQEGKLQQRVRITLRSGTVKEMLAAIDGQDGIILVYSSQVINAEKRTTLSGTEKTVLDYLETILKGQPLLIREKNGKIFLLPREENGQGRRRHTISGFIMDSKTGERLANASIQVRRKAVGTTSNAFGYFSIALPADTVQLMISYAGYTPQFTEVDLKEDKVLEVKMETNSELKEIIIASKNSKEESHQTRIGIIKLPVQTIKSLPALLGEADVMKAVQLLPGVQQGIEGTSGIYVRGGNADGSLILLDGAPVYNISHVFGLFSVFNTEAIQQITLIKGGFPASYSGRLSGVLDIRMKEGDKQHFHGEGGIGIMTSRLMLEGPIKKGKSSFMVSGRRTYFDPILNLLREWTDGKNSVKAFFYDFNAKVNFKIGRKDHIYLSAYAGQDKLDVNDNYASNFRDTSFTYTDRSRVAWDNTTAMLRWNHTFHAKLFGNLTFNYSRYRFEALSSQESTNLYNNEYTLFRQQYVSGIRDWSVRYDIDYLPHPDHFVKAGISSTLHRYRPGAAQTKSLNPVNNSDTLIQNNPINTTEWDLYVEDDWRVNTRLKVNAGLHAAGFNVQGKTFASLQPRFSAQYLLNKHWSLKTSFSRMDQYIHLLTNSTVGLPTDLWVPATRRVRPQSAYQYTLGVSYESGKVLEAEMELYYKKMNRVIEYVEGANFISPAGNWEDKVESGQGESYGAEWSLQKKKGKISGIASYTLSWSNRRFAQINEGKTFPFKFDRRHSFKLALTWRPDKRHELGAAWIFNTGNVTTIPVATYYDSYSGNQVDVYKGRNGYRLPDYHRLDISCRFIKQKKRGERSWVLAAYNAYNQLNTLFIRRGYQQPGNIEPPTFFKVAAFPIIPSFSYQRKF
jgi:outer membrane receptor for ferrienterochelin and colicin